MSKSFSEMLIDKGIRPGMKKYGRVRPRGIYKLMPSMWRTAKQLESAPDFTYDMLMNQYHIAEHKQRIAEIKASREQL